MIDLTGLNEAQYAAVTSKADRILCLAGAGTGKTRVLTHRIARLFYEGVSCCNMLALTFTRLAGVEMKERIISLIGAAEGKKLFCNTFHAFCVEVLKERGYLLGFGEDFSIMDQADQEAFIKEILQELGYKTMPLKKALEAIKGSHIKGSKEETIQREYIFRLKRNNTIDFDSLIGFTIQLFLQNPGVMEDCKIRYPYVFIDEFQDTSNDQWELINLLRPQNLFVVGDDFQSIYGWRNANINIILSLARNPTYQTVKLEENYRSTVPIVRAANTLIKKNTQTEKVLKTEKEGSDIKISFFDNEENELLYIKLYIKCLVGTGECQYRDIAVLARTNKQIEAASFVLSDIPHVVVNAIQDPMKANHVKMIFGFIEAVKNKENDGLIKKIMNYPRPVLKEKEMLKVEKYQIEFSVNLYDALRLSCLPGVAKFFKIFNDTECIVGKREYEPLLAFDEIAELLNVKNASGSEQPGDILNSARESIVKWEETQKALGGTLRINEMLDWYRLRDIQDKMADDRNEIKLMTVHASKGLEFNTVFVIGMNQGTFPSRGDIEEERRLFYVAVTRAKTNLFISRAEKKPDWSGNEIPTEESQFLQEMRC